MDRPSIHAEPAKRAGRFVGRLQPGARNREPTRIADQNFEVIRPSLDWPFSAMGIARHTSCPLDRHEPIPRSHA